MKKIINFLLFIYKNTVSVLLRSLFGKGCRFNPTCSEYTCQSIIKHGFLKGGVKSIKRFVRCNPFWI